MVYDLCLILFVLNWASKDCYKYKAPGGAWVQPGELEHWISFFQQIQWCFSSRDSFPSRGHLATYGDIFARHNWGSATGIYCVEVRDAAKQPRAQVAPHSAVSPRQHRIIWLEMAVERRSKNPNIQ